MMRRRLLIDVREDHQLRGFHALAAISIMADQLRNVGIFRLGGEEANEKIACLSFMFDTGLTLRHYSLNQMLMKPDVYVFAADSLPQDNLSVFARSRARITIAALMFGWGDEQPALNGRVVVGHDTAEIALAVRDGLRLTEPARPS